MVLHTCTRLCHEHSSFLQLLLQACQKEIVQREFREPVIDDTEGDYMEFISASIDTQVRVPAGSGPGEGQGNRVRRLPVEDCSATCKSSFD